MSVYCATIKNAMCIHWRDCTVHCTALVDEYLCVIRCILSGLGPEDQHRWPGVRRPCRWSRQRSPPWAACCAPRRPARSRPRRAAWEARRSPCARGMRRRAAAASQRCRARSQDVPTNSSFFKWEFMCITSTFNKNPMRTCFWMRRRTVAVSPLMHALWRGVLPHSSRYISI